MSTKLFENPSGLAVEDAPLDDLEDGTALDSNELEDASNDLEDATPLDSNLEDGTPALDFNDLDGAWLDGACPDLEDACLMDSNDLEDGTCEDSNDLEGACFKKSVGYCKPLPCGHQAISKTMKAQRERS